MVNYKVLIAMLLVAVFAAGAVSAAEDIAINDTIIEPADDIQIDDVPADEVVESEITDLEVNDEDTSSEDDSGLSAMTVVNFAPGTYRGTTINVQSNTIYNGNGATIYGTGTNHVFIVDNANNFVITGFNIIVNSTSKAAIYGANVFNANITNNNITGGKDGINIMQTYDNVTITGNRIVGVIRDAISLVDHRTLSDSEWTNRGCSNISNNVIIGKADYETEYGMFIGGNFKGTISGNTITGTYTGMEFAGKKAKTNGKLCVKFNNNTISNVLRGINMYHPNVLCFNITNSNIHVNSDYGDYAIQTDSFFNATGYLGVFNSNFTGLISSAFVTAVGNNKGNNVGFP